MSEYAFLGISDPIDIPPRDTDIVRVPNLCTLNMLLAIHFLGNPQHDCMGGKTHWCSDAGREARDWLLKNGLVSLSQKLVWGVTERGLAFIEHLRETPLPVRVERWERPQEPKQ